MRDSKLLEVNEDGFGADAGIGSEFIDGKKVVFLFLEIGLDFLI